MIDTAAIIAFAGIVAGLAVLAWSLLTGDEHIADLDDDEADYDRAHGGWVVMTTADDRARLAAARAITSRFDPLAADLLRMAEDGIAAREECQEKSAHIDRLVSKLDAAREREAEKDAEIEGLTGLVAAKQSWIDGAKVDLDGYDEARAAVERVRALCADDWGSLADDGERCARCRRKWSKHHDEDGGHYESADAIRDLARSVLAALDGPERPTAPALYACTCGHTMAAHMDGTFPARCDGPGCGCLAFQTAPATPTTDGGAA